MKEKENLDPSDWTLRGLSALSKEPKITYYNDLSEWLYNVARDIHDYRGIEILMAEEYKKVWY